MFQDGYLPFSIGVQTEEHFSKKVKGALLFSFVLVMACHSAEVTFKWCDEFASHVTPTCL